MWQSIVPSKAAPPLSPSVTIGVQNRLLGNCWLAPILGVILVQGMLCTVYLLAVIKSNIDPVLPFLSEAATFGPQAGLFSQFLSVIGFLELITFVARHEQVRNTIDGVMLFQDDRIRLQKLNRFTALFGIFHALLIPSVGNFRTSEHPQIHLISAMILIVMFNMSVLTTIYLTKCLFDLGVETRPTSMAINGCFHTITNLMLAGSSLLFKVIENPSSTYILVGEYSLLHNISAILQWLSFSQMSFHMLCLASRMKQFRKQNWIVQK